MPESSSLKKFWMPGKARHDGLGILYELGKHKLKNY